MKPHEETAAKELLDRLRKSNPELHAGIKNGSPRPLQFGPDEWDETEECHHGVLFCDPCEYCCEYCDDESCVQSDDMGFHDTYS